MRIQRTTLKRLKKNRPGIHLVRPKAKRLEKVKPFTYQSKVSISGADPTESGAERRLMGQIKRLEELQEQFKDTVNMVDSLKTQIKQEIIQEMFEDQDERREKEEKKSNLIICNVEEKPMDLDKKE